LNARLRRGRTRHVSGDFLEVVAGFRSRLHLLGGKAQGDAVVDHRFLAIIIPVVRDRPPGQRRDVSGLRGDDLAKIPAGRNEGVPGEIGPCPEVERLEAVRPRRPDVIEDARAGRNVEVLVLALAIGPVAGVGGQSGRRGKDAAEQRQSGFGYGATRSRQIRMPASVFQQAIGMNTPPAPPRDQCLAPEDAR